MDTFYSNDKNDIDSELIENLQIQIAKILERKDKCVIAIAGGRSIASILDILVEKQVDWEKLHIFAVDDRCVSINSEESNSGLLQRHLACKAPVFFHPFIYTPEQADRGAKSYTDELNKVGGKFDILLLSSGEDGHTAGLFPNHSSFANESAGYIFFDNSPKDPPERISATKDTLLKSTVAFILFVGEAKQSAYESFMDETSSLESCPSKLVQSLAASFVYTDRIRLDS